MKKLSDLKKTTKKELKEVTIQNIREIMAKNPDIDLTKIKSVGKIETGDLQFKIPETIRNRQVVLLVAYLSWFAEINLGDLK